MPGTFNAEAARRAGYTDAEIAYFLGQERGFDVQGAQAAGYSFSEIVNYLATTPPKKQVAERAAATGPVEENLLEKIPVIGKPIAAVADVPVKIGKGAVSGIRMIAQAAGADSAVANTLQGVEDYLGSIVSAQSRKDSREVSRIMKEAEDKGVGAQVLAGLQALTVAPIDLLAEGVGTAAPALAAAAGTALASAPAAVIGGVGVGVGALMGAGATKDAIYDAVKEEYQKAGVPEEKAKQIAEEAQEYTGKNFGQIAFGAGLGGLASATGIEGSISKIVGQRVFGRLAAKEAAEEAAKGIGRRSLGAGIKEAAPEFIQGSQEQLAQNLALQREGFDVDTMRGVVGAGTLEGLVGGGLGTGFGAVEALGDRRIARAEEAVAKAAETAARRAGMAPEEAAFEAEVERLTTVYNMKREDAEAVARTNLAQEAANVGATDTGGTERGIPSVGGEAVAGGLAGDVEAATPGSVGATGVSAGEVAGREGPQQPALTIEEAAPILADKKVKKAERLDIARNILNETILSNPAIDVNQIGQKEFNQAKQQLADGKHGGNPVAALEAVTGKTFALPEIAPAPSAELTAEVTAAPEVVAPPSVDEVATAPIAQALDQTVAPTSEAAVPTAADAAAIETGISPTIQEKIDTKRAELAQQEEADAQAEALLREDMARRAAEEVLPEVAPVEEAVTEAAVEPAPEAAPEPIEESVAPVEEAAPTEEAVVEEPAPEDEALYDDILNEIEDARWDEEAGQQIDDKAYNLLINATENRRKPVEEIRAALEGAKTRYAEEAMGERFRPGEPGTVTAEQVAPIVQAAAQRTGVTAPRVVQSVTELPPPLQQAITKGGTLSPSGVVDSEGNVFIVADNLNSPEEATATLFHETLGHIGLAKKFRQRLDSVLRNMYDTNRKLREEADAWRAANPKAYAGDADPLARAVEEILARRSEEGRIEANLLAKIAAVIKDFARRIGIKSDFSDAEINSILAMAHDRAVREGRQTGPEGARFQTRKAKKLEAAAKKAEKSDDKVSRGMRKVELSNMADDLFGEDVRKKSEDIIDDGIGTAIEGHSASDFMDGLKDNYDAIGDTMLKYFLKALPGDAIVAWKEGDIPALRRLETLTDKMGAERATYLRSFANMANKLGKFVSKHGQKVLGSTMHLARLNRVDPTAHENVDAALKNDPVMRRYEALIAATKKDPKKSAAYKGKLTQRTKQIKEVYKLWEQLGEQEGGHKAYIEMRQFYKDMYSAVRVQLDKQIEELDIDDVSKSNLLRAVRMEREKERTGKQQADDEYPEIEAAEFPEQYFPFKRYGDYWLRVGKGETGREFYTFESARERNKFLRKRARQLNVPMTDARFRMGNDITALREEFETDSAMLQKMFSVIDGAATKGTVDVSGIKDQLYQVYLMTLPERSIRKQFLHADNVTGFSADVFRNFKTSAVQYANQLVSLKYNRQINNTIEEAKASIGPDSGVPAREAARLESFVNEVGQRAKDQINPDEAGPLVRAVNRAAFLWYLTSAATASAQVLGIPIRVMPRLTSDYGYAKSIKMLGKYSKIWDSLGIVEEDEGELSYTGPTVGESQFVRSNPVLKRAFDIARDERSVFETQAAQILSSTPTPSRASKFAPGQINEQVINGMSVMFNTTERVSREVTFMMAFELEYAKTKDFDASVDKAVAIVNDTLGNYSDFNRPGFMKGDLGRAVFLFKQYAVNTTAFFYNNMRRIITGGETGFLSVEDRFKALNELTGVLLMGGLFHGITGFPLFSLIATIIDALEADDDDEEAQLRRAKNPYTAHNSAYRFQFEWLPSKFGHITIPGIDGSQHRLSDILANGPITELSDINFASRTTFDNLWFREGKPSDTTSEAILRMVEANVPGLSLVTSTADGIDDMRKGEVVRGLEKTLPAFFKGFATGYRLSEEGAMTRGELPMLSKDEVKFAQVAAQAAGFGSTKLAQIQKERIARDKLFREVQQERTGLLRDLNEARYTAAAKPEEGQKNIDEAIEAIYEFNAKHPVIGVGITYDTIEDSYKSFLRERKYQMRGSTFTKKEAPYAVPGIMAAAPE